MSYVYWVDGYIVGLVISRIELKYFMLSGGVVSRLGGCDFRVCVDWGGSKIGKILLKGS